MPMHGGSHTWAAGPGPPVRGGGGYVLGSGPNTTPQSFTEKHLAQDRAVQVSRRVRRVRPHNWHMPGICHAT